MPLIVSLANDFTDFWTCINRFDLFFSFSFHSFSVLATCYSSAFEHGGLTSFLNHFGWRTWFFDYCLLVVNCY